MDKLLTIGPLARTEQLAFNYRPYGLEAKRRSRFIRRAQALGFSLAEQNIADIERKIAGLERMKAGLDVLAGQWPGHGSTAECPILGALLKEDQ